MNDKETYNVELKKKKVHCFGCFQEIPLGAYRFLVCWDCEKRLIDEELHLVRRRFERRLSRIQSLSNLTTEHALDLVGEAIELSFERGKK